MTLQAQLRLIAIITLISLSGVVIFAVIQLSMLRNTFDQYQNQQVYAANLSAIKSEALAISRADPILQETAQELALADKKIHTLHQSTLLAAQPGVDQAKLKQLLNAWEAYAKGLALATRIASTSPADAVTAQDMLYGMHTGPMITDINALLEANKSAWADSNASINSAVDRIIWIIVLPLVFAGIVIIAFQARFNRHLKKRVDDVIRAMDHLINGDLTHRLPTSHADEIGVMACTVNSFIANFESILREVNLSSEQASKASGKVLQMTHAVSTNANAQSAKASNANDSIQEMRSTIFAIAENANFAADAANRTREQVREGSEAGRQTLDAISNLDITMNESVQTMDGLNQTLNRVNDISKIIKDIAGQTNLLALNAAIEAARAGEHGRGFAVVADEVRILSDRTANSARDITELLNEVQISAQNAVSVMQSARETAKVGVTRGKKTDAVLAEIGDSMQLVALRMQQIAQATQEQSTSGELIAAHMAEVHSISANTSDDLDNTRDEMEGLARASEVLHRSVSRFRFSEIGSGSGAGGVELFA
ncbi:MAG: methyl-accepting chemotaxis protein [Proteobacteria bacterium]|nr:methyl-accepting chemotaxis protein [Pseudomonadota bacterium]